MHLAESQCCTRINESAVDADTVSGRSKGRAHREVYRTISTILKVIDSPPHAVHLSMQPARHQLLLTAQQQPSGHTLLANGLFIYL